MRRLADFESKDFIEQISILNALVEKNDSDSITALTLLMEKIPEYDAVGLVIRDTLKSLLPASEENTTDCLASGNREVRNMCIEVAGQAAAENDHGMLFILLSSLAQLNPRDPLDLFREHLGHEDPSVASVYQDDRGPGRCRFIRPSLRDHRRGRFG